MHTHYQPAVIKTVHTHTHAQHNITAERKHRPLDSSLLVPLDARFSPFVRRCGYARASTYHGHRWAATSAFMCVCLCLVNHPLVREHAESGVARPHSATDWSDKSIKHYACSLYPAYISRLADCNHADADTDTHTPKLPFAHNTHAAHMGAYHSTCLYSLQQCSTLARRA